MHANIKTVIVENTQRDINVALRIDQLIKLSLIANKKMELKFYVIGGYQIGVDPYYLKYKAIKKRLKPKIISSGREVKILPNFIFNEILW